MFSLGMNLFFNKSSKMILPVFDMKNNVSGIRYLSSKKLKCENENVKSCLTNRNPRNLERLRIARKPTGFHLDKPGSTFWHKVVLEKKPRYIIAGVYHNNGNLVVQASTNEYSIGKYLYKTNDLASYSCLGKVLAWRCLESGIQSMINGIDINSSKNKEFVNQLESCGISLNEAETYLPLTPWSLGVEDKPWKVNV